MAFEDPPEIRPLGSVGRGVVGAVAGIFLGAFIGTIFFTLSFGGMGHGGTATDWGHVFNSWIVRGMLSGALLGATLGALTAKSR